MDYTLHVSEVSYSGKNKSRSSFSPSNHFLFKGKPKTSGLFSCQMLRVRDDFVAGNKLIATDTKRQKVTALLILVVTMVTIIEGMLLNTYTLCL